MNVRSFSALVLGMFVVLTVVSSRARADEAPAAGPPLIEALPSVDTEKVEEPASPAQTPRSAEAPAPGAAPDAAAPQAHDPAAAPSSPPVRPVVSAPADAAVWPPAPVQLSTLEARPATVATASFSSAVVAPSRRRMGWFGVGLRYGTSSLHLAPSGSLINRVDQASGQSFTPSDFTVDSTARTLTPTLHFGGSGYFFKLEVPFGFAPEFTTFGLGVYPINVGVFISELSLFPYLSLGGAANIVMSRTTFDPGTTNKAVGAIVQARAAVGAKYFPVRGLALSAEIGYSPWAAGIMLMPPSAAPGTGADDQTRMQGGTGSVIDFSLGAEWL